MEKIILIIAINNSEYYLKCNAARQNAEQCPCPKTSKSRLLIGPQADWVQNQAIQIEVSLSDTDHDMRLSKTIV